MMDDSWVVYVVHLWPAVSILLASNTAFLVGKMGQDTTPFHKILGILLISNPSIVRCDYMFALLGMFSSGCPDSELLTFEKLQVMPIDILPHL